MATNVKYDAVTQSWFDKEPPYIQTTVMQCKECGLWYKPSLGHKCEDPENEAKRKAKAREYYCKNKERIKEYQKRYYEERKREYENLHK